MKRVLIAAGALGLLMVMPGETTWALSPETVMLLDLLKAKGVITQQDAEEFTKTLEDKAMVAAPAEDGHYHSVQSLSDRVERLEGKTAEGGAGTPSKVNFSGLLEANLSTARTKDEDGHARNSSDATLATAQLNADATVNQYINAHLALLYEEDTGAADDNTVTLDEAFIGVNGGEAYPLYANFGRQYIPFGHFESHFISDPVTLTLGETNDTAVVAGYADDILDLSAGVLKGKVREMGKGAHINTAVASATLSLPKEDEGGLTMSGGVSYLSNLATSDGLEAETTDDKVLETVDGASVFLSVAYGERFFLDAEYLAALKDFADDDLTFVNDANRRPQAWNLEAAVKVAEGMEFAVRYGGSNEAANFLANNEYGAALLSEILTNTSLTIEYLFQEFQEESNNSQASMQMAVEF